MTGHTTVLLNEAVDMLVTKKDGFYIDGTFGRGGHSQAILNQLNAEGTLLVIDKDPQAIAQAEALAQSDARVLVRRGSFADISGWVSELKKSGLVDGVLLDLGVSSPQLDDAERGFSFLREGPLDMRMNPDAGLSAKEWLAAVEFETLVTVLKRYGEEKFGRRIATAIKENINQLHTTLDLAEVIDKAVPVKDKFKHPATRSFQAIRIAVNQELDDLESFLNSALSLLAVEGRLVVISFHSLEDRLVKHFIRDNARAKQPPRGIPIKASQLAVVPLKKVGKAIKASAEEVSANPRSRSAVMRVAEKVA